MQTQKRQITFLTLLVTVSKLEYKISDPNLILFYYTSLQDLICNRTNVSALKSSKFLQAFSKTQGSESTTFGRGRGGFLKIGKLKGFPQKSF